MMSSTTFNMNDPAASPIKLAPATKKQRLSTDFKKCLICQDNSVKISKAAQKVAKHSNLSKAGKEGIKSIIRAAKIRQDDIYQVLSSEWGENIDDLPNKQISISYHRKCYQSYTSEHNLKYVKHPDTPAAQCPLASPSQGLASSSQESDTFQDSSTKAMRSTITPVNWKSCLFCQFKKYKGDNVLHLIQTTERALKIFDSAVASKDDTMLLKITGEDLIAREAVYHNGCMARYLKNKQAIDDEKTCTMGTLQVSDRTMYDASFHLLVKEIYSELFEQHKVLLLSDLLARYHELLPSAINANHYTTYKLQAKLLGHFGHSITIQRQQGQGKSNMVMSSNITIGDAIRAAEKLKIELRTQQQLIHGQLEDSQNFNKEGAENLETLREAASILRNAIDGVALPDNYPPACGVTQDASNEMIPSQLIQFLLWLIDKNAYESDIPEITTSDEKLRKATAMAECIVHTSSTCNTPLHLGMAITLHHEYGSRNLIDLLHTYGFCVSYQELRLFLTSTAEDEVKKIRDGVYIPSDINAVEDGGMLIQEGDDNVDINCQTVDGKNTFHSMARVVFQQRPMKIPIQQRTIHVTRGTNRSLPVTPDMHKLMKADIFDKPRIRPEPTRHDKAVEMLQSCVLGADVCIPELKWVLLRMVSRNVLPLPTIADISDHQVIPFWSGHNKTLTPKQDGFTAVGYAPIIDAKPSDMATVYTTMNACKKMTEALGQTYSIQTMDQQLYAVAQQVKWHKSEHFSHHILRLGGFHELMCFIAAIGKIWGDAGLKEMIVDADIYASATAEQMLMGKQFHRAVRGLTLVYEVLTAIQIEEFIKWCSQESHLEQIPQNLWQQLAHTQSTYTKRPENNEQMKDETLDKVLKDDFLPLLKQFKEWGSSQSPTFKFWDKCLDALQVMLLNIRAERQGNWALHLHTQSLMLPYFFVADRTNYARYTPVYLLDMLELPGEVAQAFESGQFTFKEKPGSFNGIWTDMAVEKTVIRDSKSNSGIIGLTRKAPALLRWSITRHILGQYADEIKKRGGLTTAEDQCHQEAMPAGLKRDESHFDQLYNHIQTNMTNPFSVKQHPACLVNIASGIHATTEVQDSLLTASTKGLQQMEKFINAALDTEGSTSFYQPIKRSGLLTFAEMHKKTKVKGPKGNLVLMNMSPELVFRRALCLAQCRDDVTLEMVLSHVVGPVPSSIFKVDGAMRKPTKSDLAHKLEANVEKVTTLSDFNKAHSVYIRDAMSVIQMTDVQNGQTFSDVAKRYKQNLLSGFKKADTIVDVFDRYDNDDSVKAPERARREAIGIAERVYEVTAGRIIPPWDKFINVAANKQAFINFVCSVLTKTLGQSISNEVNKAVFLSGGFENPLHAKCITSNGVEDVEQLFSSQEEADSRMFLHVCHANAMFANLGISGRIILRSQDTDVLVLAIYYFPQLENISELWIECGTTTSTANLWRFVPVHKICEALSPTLCSVLPAVHALTGSDSTSAFFQIGKNTVYKVIKSQSAENLQKLIAVGGENKDAAIAAAQYLVTTLYDQTGRDKDVHTDINKLRVRQANRKVSELARLPPCMDSFVQHVFRVMWQTKIWTNAHVAMPDLGSPEDYGWKRENSVLVPCMFTSPMASQFLNGLVCSCTANNMCSSNTKCVCRKQGLPCVEMCSCQAAEGCCNSITYATNVDED